MATAWTHGRKVYVAYVDHAHPKANKLNGQVVLKTEFKPHQMDEARKFGAALEKRRKEGDRVAPGDPGPLTLRAFIQKSWLPERRASGIASIPEEESRIGNYIVPALGSMPLADIRRLHVRDFLRDLQQQPGVRKDKLGPRYVRHLYDDLRRILQDAVIEELIQTNPCMLKRRELPRKLDLDPFWRATAVYTPDEMWALIYDARVPEDRRMLYGLLFYGGLRPGEASALRISSYNPDLLPLGRIILGAAFSTKLGIEKSVKTGRARELPVHPHLASMATEWLRDGWQRMMGRIPTGADLFIPSREGRNRTGDLCLRRLHGDLARLGFRSRRVYDTRRSFISHARAGGADPSLLRFVTHGRSTDIMDVYTSPPWASLCKQVLYFKLSPPPGHELPPRPALATVESAGASRAPTTLVLQRLQTVVLTGEKWRERVGIEPTAERFAAPPLALKARRPTGAHPLPFR